MRILFSLILLGSSLPYFSQKKELNPSVYDAWKKLEHEQISSMGNTVTYEITPLKGDGYLYIYNNLTKIKDSIPRGTQAKISFDGEYVVFKITPSYDTLRKVELKKIKKDKWPKDSLGIFHVSSRKLEKISSIKSFDFSEKGNLLVYLKHENSKRTKKEKRKLKGVTSKGTELCYRLLPQVETHCFSDVTEFLVDPKGNSFAFIQHQKHKVDSLKLNVQTFPVINLSEKKHRKNTIKTLHTPASRSLAYFGLQYDQEGTRLAFLTSRDTTTKKHYQLGLFDLKSSRFEIIVDSTKVGLKKGMTVSEHFKVKFSEGLSGLYFEAIEAPEKNKKDTLLEREKVVLDIWSWKDQRLQSQQLATLYRDAKKGDLYFYDFQSKKVNYISNDTLKWTFNRFKTNDFVLAKSNESYQFSQQWDMNSKGDYYLLNVKTGESTPLPYLKGLENPVEMHPEGKTIVYFDENNYWMHSLDASDKNPTCITCSIVDKTLLLEDVNGMPQVPTPLGILGWTKSEVWIQGKYQIYTYDIVNQKLGVLIPEVSNQPVKLAIRTWESDSIFLKRTDMAITFFNEKTKDEGVSLWDENTQKWELKSIDSKKITQLLKAKHSQRFLFRKMDLKTYPELLVMDEHFANEEKISITNPEQAQYNWAEVELVQWKTKDQIPLEGLLYRPENYDPTKKYPLLIYYYELNSDNLHNYYSPKPTASIIYPTEYASAGYFVFIPDIRYQTGHPGKSAYDCILSGADAMLKKYPAIDSTRMGLQGQSWGGYQTAQLITMTNRFKAAMAGAPVSNMFSAYGGIRWGSGMNRQFQYEKGQSRIGATIWEKPELYIENSPLFHLPKVNTPLLIMANDMDDAVPWYQGIELFTTMKRLQKPCWMLNYNDDKHNLTKMANRIDLSIRMRQFFDHYLLDKPMPKWMSEGLPATEKGKTLNY